MTVRTAGRPDGLLALKPTSNPAPADVHDTSHRPPTEAQAMASALSGMICRLIDAFDLNASDVAGILGVSESFMSKLRRDRAVLVADSHPYQNAVLFVRTIEALNSLLGIRASVRRYLYDPHETLAGPPIKLMRSPEGLVDVTRYVESFVH